MYLTHATADRQGNASNNFAQYGKPLKSQVYGDRIMAYQKQPSGEPFVLLIVLNGETVPL
jgi:hypothetical protein